MNAHEAARRRLLLALSVLSGRHLQPLSEYELDLIGIQVEAGVFYSEELIKYKCEVLVVEAIMAGGYQ